MDRADGVFGGKGPALFVSVPDTYLNLRPVAAERPAGHSTLWIAIVVAAGLAVVVVALALVRSRRERAEAD